MGAPAWPFPYPVPMSNVIVELLLHFAAGCLHTFSMIWSWNKMVLRDILTFLSYKKNKPLTMPSCTQALVPFRPSGHYRSGPGPLPCPAVVLP